MNETKHPLPWQVGKDMRGESHHIFDASKNPIAMAYDGPEAQKIVEAANALKPMQWRTITKDGKPNHIGWYLCTVREHGMPVLRCVDAPNDIQDFVCWMPIPDVPIQQPDPFDVWLSTSGCPSVNPDLVRFAKQAWDAATATVKSQNNI